MRRRVVGWTKICDFDLLFFFEVGKLLRFQVVIMGDTKLSQFLANSCDFVDYIKYFLFSWTYFFIPDAFNERCKVTIPLLKYEFRVLVSIWRFIFINPKFIKLKVTVFTAPWVLKSSFSMGTYNI
jgi:hypothetical protein